MRNKEEKRKMMAERKFKLKQKLSAIKIQKFWKARLRRRQLKLKHLAFISAIRCIQRWYRQVFKIKKAKQEILKECKTFHLDKIVKIQQFVRKRKTQTKRLNIRRFKDQLLAALKGWKIRRIFAILRNDEKYREAIDIIKLNEETKKKGNNLFFKQFIEKFPEMMKLFHSKFNELFECKTWFEKPVIKIKILTNKNVLKSKRNGLQMFKKGKSKESNIPESKVVEGKSSCKDSTAAIKIPGDSKLVKDKAKNAQSKLSTVSKLTRKK